MFEIQGHHDLRVKLTLAQIVEGHKIRATSVSQCSINGPARTPERYLVATSEWQRRAEQDGVSPSSERTKVARFQPARDELYAMGKALRNKCPRKAHAEWKPADNRPNPVQLALQAEKGRMSDLLPLRHGRMARSPFTFYRGAALTMAYDLVSTPSTGVRVQCCGDAHLCNFGGFGTPDRKVIFSVNDLDETLPAPWEWDLKRLAGSFFIACQDNGLSDRVANDVVLTCARTYRESMAELSNLKTLEGWYQAVDADELIASVKDTKLRQRALKRLQQERSRDIAEDIFPELTERKGKMPVIRDQPPTIFHPKGFPPGKIETHVSATVADYRETLSFASGSLLDRYQLRDAAIKVAGIGSVGTRCWVLLFMAAEDDPLFLQVKEARASVLEPYAGMSRFVNHGQRVVNGYRLMQPATDMFLGWTVGTMEGRHYFIRQLRDIRISARVESFGAYEMELYATWCGKALALSHTRSGCAITLSGYMGRSETFDQAIAKFSAAYAEQNERDHAAFERAVRKGKVAAVFAETRSA
jgi:uncharacterized protein (DUF2252 family)